MRKKADRATYKETIAVNDRLKEVIEKLDGDFCVYKGNYSDQMVADELAVSRATVQRVRMQIYGKTKRSSSPRLAEMEIIIENIVHCYDDLKDRYNKLVMLLALNKVVDCRHLKKD